MTDFISLRQEVQAQIFTPRAVDEKTVASKPLAWLAAPNDP